MPLQAPQTTDLSRVSGQKDTSQNRVQFRKVYPVFDISRLFSERPLFPKPLVFRDIPGIRKLSEIRHGTTEPKGLNRFKQVF